MSLNQEIESLKNRPDFKKHCQVFEDTVKRKDRLTNPMRWYLLYDIDDKKWTTHSEISATHNQIAFIEATVPGKKDKVQEIEIKELSYI